MGRLVIPMLAVFSIAFALGTGMGFLIGRSGPLEEAARAAPDAQPAAGESAGEPADRPGVTVKNRGAIGRGGARGGSLAEFLSSLPSEPVAGGEGVIRGSVRLEGGEPLAGARVVAQRIREDRGERRRSGRARSEPDLEERVRDLVREERWASANRREAWSGEDGAFSVTGLADAGYRLEASLEGYQIRREETRGGFDAHPGDQVNFVARPVLKVTVSVLLPDGTPPASARVHSDRPGRRGNVRSGEDWTPEDPVIELEPGTHRLHATHGENEELASSTVTVMLEVGAVPPAVTLQLRERPGIRGRLLRHAGDGFDQFEVRAVRIRPDEPPDAKRLADEGKPCPARGDDLRFSFRDLLPGTYLMGASRGVGWGRLLAAEVVEVVDRVVERDLTLPPLEPGDYFVLRVFGPRGEVLTDVDIDTAVRGREGGSSSGTAARVLQSDGSFLVLHREWTGGEDQEADYSVAVRAESFPRKTVDYQRSQTSEITVRFTEPAVLEVTVEGYSPAAHLGTFSLKIEEDRREQEPADESPGERFRRISRARRFRSSPELEARDLAEGSSTFGPLEPGAYLLFLHYQTRRDRVPAATLPVNLRPGRNTVSLPLPRLHSLRVLASPTGSRTTLRLSPAQKGGEDWELSRTLGADGQVFFDGLPEGTYQVARFGSGESENMLVSLPGPSQVQFQSRRLNALQVTVDEPDGEMARAGFQTGDLIVGINGSGFEDQNGWRNLLRQFPRDQEAKFLVQRGGGTIEIALKPRKLHDGASLEPASR